MRELVIAFLFSLVSYLTCALTSYWLVRRCGLCDRRETNKPE